jgi:acyl-CoA dehydrogenase
MIIFGQGAIRCHPYLIQMVELLDKKEVSVCELDQLLTRFANYSLGNSVRAIWLSFTTGFTSKAPHKSPLKRYYQYCNLYSAQLALLSDTSLLLLGGQLKRKEAISARLGDILSVLYLCSAILKQQHDTDYQHTHVAKFALDSLLNEIEISVSELLDNYPKVTLGWGLKRLLMPFGRRRKTPSDIACHHLALQMQKPSSLRDYFTNAVDLQAVSTSASAKVNHALQVMIDIEPIVEKIANNSGRTARYNFLDKQGKEGLERGWISQDEYKRLILAEEVRLSVINVDDFAPDEIAHS